MSATAPGQSASSEQLILDRIGGRKGFVYATIPVVVFVIANLFLALTATVAVAVAVASR
jgi:hypothetical protein